MLSSIVNTIAFCQLPEQITSSCMPIGSWFEKLFVNTIDWDTATDYDYETCNAREDFITEKLCELHSLPFRRSCFTNNDLAQLATPEQQATIWRAMLDKFS